MEVIFAQPRRSADGQPPNAGKEAKRAMGSWSGAEDAASTCMLWCSVAIGALVQGEPPENVSCLLLRQICKGSSEMTSLRHGDEEKPASVKLRCIERGRETEKNEHYSGTALLYNPASKNILRDPNCCKQNRCCRHG